jgi:DNA invertase Pin-like site-specific DNA recombinase
MPGADDLMMRTYAAMAQKERELIGERTRAALGGDRGYRPATGPDSGAAALARRLAAAQAAHRLALEVERLRREGVGTLQRLARALSGRGVPTPSAVGVWTHTTVARVLAQAAG